MFVCQRLHGQWVSEEDFALLERLIAAHPQWSRRQLSVEVASLWNWRTATGQLRDMAVRTVLNQLQERGLLELPARQKRGGQRSRPLSPGARFRARAGTSPGATAGAPLPPRFWRAGNSRRPRS